MLVVFVSCGPPDSSTVHFVLPVLNIKKESSSGSTCFQERRRYRTLLHKMLIYNATLWILEICSKTIPTLDVVSIHNTLSVSGLAVTVFSSLGVSKAEHNKKIYSGNYLMLQLTHTLLCLIMASSYR